MIKRDSKIYVAGHTGMVGSAITRALHAEGFQNVITRRRSELNLVKQAEVSRFLSSAKPDYVIIAAARVGGIYANDTYSADFIYENLMVQCNLINGCYESGIFNALFLGSSCIYPKLCDQPMKEEYLLTGELEKTNEAYAIAKIAGLKLCEYYNRQYATNFRAVMPTNLYGVNDNFNLQDSHVIPALIRKIHDAKINNSAVVELWGTGQAKREFLNVDDMADACMHIVNLDGDIYNQVVGDFPYVNIGYGSDITIRNLASKISQVVGYKGAINFDCTMPDGPPQKLLDSSRMKAVGWIPKIDLLDGLSSTYKWFLENSENFRR